MTDVERLLLKQGFSPEEVSEIFYQMCDDVLDGQNPEDVLEEFDIESDYILDIL